MLTIIDFDPFAATGKAWEDYFVFCRSIAPTSIDFEEFKLWVQERQKGNSKKFQFIYRDDQLVMAIISFTKKDLSGNEMLFISLDTILTGKSNALNDCIANQLLRIIENHQLKLFRITTANPFARKMIALFNGQLVNTINYYQLQRNQLNEDLVKDWHINKYIETGELKLARYEYVPEHLYADYAGLLTILMNDIERNDRAEYFEETVEKVKQKMALFKSTGVKMLTMMLSDTQGRLVGLSIMLVYPGTITANQEMTGIIAPYRGKKLASYLKAAMTQEVFKRFPEIEKIETNCYDVNQHMIRINQAIGYSLKEKSQQFEVSASNIRTFLASNQNS
jgi:RimJ/RimL family protein N-acetyltransferase